MLEAKKEGPVYKDPVEWVKYDLEVSKAGLAWLHEITEAAREDYTTFDILKAYYQDRADTDACAQRARYHSAAIDTRTLKKKQKFKELLDNYVIFITENDVLKGDQAAYIIERTIVGTKVPFNDGSHIIYVNGAYIGTDTPLEKLIHDFSCKSSKEMLCQPMAEVTRQFKETEEGRTLMCKEIEEYGNAREKQGRQKGRQEGILDTIISLVRDGLLPVSEAVKRTSLSAEEIQRLAAQNS